VRTFSVPASGYVASDQVASGTPPQPLPAGTWRWKARTWDLRGGVSSWSGERVFQVQNSSTTGQGGQQDEPNCLSQIGTIQGPPSCVGASIDMDLLDAIDAALQSDPGFYYNNQWNVSRNQYKAWIATIAWAEGLKSGYGTHSRSNLGVDRFNHRHAGECFYFSTGLGYFQIDRGGQYCNNQQGSEEWEKWSTLAKLDITLAVSSVMRWHYNSFGNGATLRDFLNCSRWFALDSEEEASRLWWQVTGTSWANHAARRVEDLDWNTIRGCLAANAQRGFWFPYNKNVRFVGEQYFNIGSNNRDIDTGQPLPVTIVGCRPTYLISARHDAGERGVIMDFQYYYTLDTNSKVEVWVWKDPNESLTHIFTRHYNQGQNPDNINENTAGYTLQFPAIIRRVCGGFILDDSGDVNGDGCVDDADLLAVLFAFGCSTGCGVEDINGDGVVDDADLLEVLFNFGSGC
jgi:hypothetical protein